MVRPLSTSNRVHGKARGIWFAIRRLAKGKARSVSPLPGKSTLLIVSAVLSCSCLFSVRSRQVQGPGRKLAVRVLRSEKLGQCKHLGMGKENSYVFVHLHKTAGNNLKRALFGFAKRNNLHLYHTCRRAGSDDWLTRWWFQRPKKTANDYDCNLFKFLELPYSERNSFDIVVGHQYVGIHELMPARDVSYFTFMRDPLARKVSHFEHFETKAEATIGSPPMDVETQLWKYLTERNRNYVTKRLSTSRVSSEIWADLRSRLIDASSIFGEIALANAKKTLLERFFFVGLQERYAESLCILANILNNACYANNDGIDVEKGKLLDPEKISRSRVNVRSRARQRLREIPPHVHRKALDAEYLDLALYDIAKELFEEELSRHPQCRTLETP